MFYDVSRTSVIDKYAFRKVLAKKKRKKSLEMVNKVMVRSVDLDLFS